MEGRFSGPGGNMGPGEGPAMGEQPAADLVCTC